MERRQLLAVAAASALFSGRAQTPEDSNVYLELKTWRLHNTEENQAARVADFLQAGLGPGLARSGARLIGAFSNVIAPDGPFYVTLAQYPSLAAFQDSLGRLTNDDAYQRELEKLGAGQGLPFVRVESSLLRTFDGMRRPAVPDPTERRPPRVFEMRTYESQSFTTLARKIGMFNGGEISIFERLGMHPVFFGETIVGPRQPNLTYMLSFDDLGDRDRLWQAFGMDAQWKKLSSEPRLKDQEIVANISNVILRPLTFSLIR